MSDVTKDTGFSGHTNTYTTTFSVNGTVAANSNRVLIGVVEFNDRASNLGAVTMTWDGVSMTAIGNLDFPSGSQGSVYMFGIINPNTGTKSLVVNSTAITSSWCYLGALSAYNTTGWQNSGSDSGNSTSASSTVTSASHNMVVVGHGNRNASSTTLDAGPVQTWVDTTGTNNAGEASYLSTSASTIVSWTLGTAVNWANIKTDLIATATDHPITMTSGSLTMSGQSVILRPGSTTYLRYRK